MKQVIGDMQDTVTRLIAIKKEANTLIKTIDEQFDDGETLSGGLYSVMHDIDATVGAIMIQAYDKDRLSFSSEVAGPTIAPSTPSAATL